MKLADLFSDYYTVRAELVDSVREMKQSQLDWTAFENCNSIGDLLRHIAWWEHWWINEIALGKSGGPERKQFESERTITDIIKLLNRSHNDFSEYLKAHDTNEWDQEFFYLARADRKVSMRWLVWHVVEHQARHRGQILMLKRMQGLRGQDG